MNYDSGKKAVIAVGLGTRLLMVTKEMLLLFYLTLNLELIIVLAFYFS